jgi:GDP/UDP-N,N'-diacetylbacillosamine 2-epimerase (hydrolysing)
MKKYKIIIFSSGRSDFDLIKPLIKKFKSIKQFNVQLLVSGSHFSNTHGKTYKKILEEKIIINKKINLNIKTINSNNFGVYIAKAIKLYSKYLVKNNFNLAVVLGDRFETYAFALACYLKKIFIAHIHGGEVTKGSLDDGFRHSITKFSHLHFASNNVYKTRIIQLGENPKTVYNVGSLGVENIKSTKFFSKIELEKDLKFKFFKKNLVVTVHPVTSGDPKENNLINELIKVIYYFDDILFIFNSPNVDPGSNIIYEKINNLINKKKVYNCLFFKSLGQQKYFSLIRNSDGLIGNSSSGIIEVPYLQKPTINIGSRQYGRFQSSSIINCDADYNSIIRSVKNLYNMRSRKYKFSQFKTSSKIISIIKNFSKNSNKSFSKTFFNL